MPAKQSAMRKIREVLRLKVETRLSHGRPARPPAAFAGPAHVCEIRLHLALSGVVRTMLPASSSGRNVSSPAAYEQCVERPAANARQQNLLDRPLTDFAAEPVRAQQEDVPSNSWISRSMPGVCPRR
jgi:hypothetical protein